MKKSIIIGAALALAALPGVAEVLKVSTGSAGLTYSKMFKEMADVCNSDVTMVEQPSTGSIENINRLVNNEVNAAISQTDILFFRSTTENLSNIKTLIALHPEEVHIIGSTRVHKQGGMMGIGGKEYTITAFEQLAGRIVAAAGGSHASAQIIRLQSDVGFKLAEYKSNADALAALKAGQVDAVLLVSGAPAGDIQKLDRATYRLLTFTEATISKLKGVYRPARLTYPNLGANGVATVATEALFVTREYKTPKFRTALNNLRQCLLKNIDELKETTGTHPKWQLVDTANRGKWQWYNLP